MNKPLTVSQQAMDGLSKKDKRLGAYIASVGELTREGIIDPYEALLDCIIAQQVSSKVAITMSKRFFDKYPLGDPIRVAHDPIEELRSLGFSGSKASYLQGIAKIRSEGSIDFDQLGTKSTQEIMDTLLPIKGIGRWTVEMLLIFTYEKQDVMSFGDLAIRRGIERIYHKKECTKEFFDTLYQRYAPYQTAASFYLWQASLSPVNIPYTSQKTTRR
ncbi:MAG: DNA-3-methyladenine glycosylase 2 family protein [Erysipelotrichales bacterium]|nr:MAG: DNA-3-methyladenine glycosylase 2 family protein [Erysipelotrichales bacterium]